MAIEACNRTLPDWFTRVRTHGRSLCLDLFIWAERGFPGLSLVSCSADPTLAVTAVPSNSMISCVLYAAAG